MVITGAGVSAASGVPTFRGPEGYWTVGSRVYRPMELATRAAFDAMPREVWRWYLYRLGVCLAAAPNPAHAALVRVAARLGDAFGLITQNVDGLPARAGQVRAFAVHGDLRVMRDGRRLTPVPPALALPDRDAPLDDNRWEALVHPETGRRCRPHVLWFDEYYEEELYRADSALALAARASVVVVVGTSGAAALPGLAVERALAAGATLVDISPEPNPFRDWARRSGGVAVDATAVDGLAALERTLLPR